MLSRAMSELGKFRDASALYRKHGWRLVRALMREETLKELGNEAVASGDEKESLTFEGAPAYESEMNAMWFTRAAAGGREAWELRLVADPPYALFELFEADEAEEDRAEVRREMESRMCAYAGGGGGEATGE